MTSRSLALSWALAAAGPLSPADVATLQSARNVGLAALEQDDPAEAARRFEIVRKLAPSDPLGWADGAIAAMRQKDLGAAGKLLAQARALAPGDARVLALQGTLDELAGDLPGAVVAFRKAAAASPKDVASRWAAARLESEQGPEGKRRALSDDRGRAGSDARQPLPAGAALGAGAGRGRFRPGGGGRRAT